MRKVNRPPDSWQNVVFFLVGSLVVFADQLSKIWIRTNLLRGQSLFDIGFFQIVRIQNTGAAFGLFQDQAFVLSIASFTGVIVILLCAFFLPRHIPFLGTIPAKSALGLVLGGTIGNLIDRLAFGYVTDFISFSFWPAFNIADSAVTVGALWLAYSIFRQALAEKH